MKAVSNFTHPGGWTLHALPPGEASPMAGHLGGEIAADDAGRRFIIHEVFLVFQGLAAIEKACARYPPSLPPHPAPQALYTVATIDRRSGRESAPRFDLAPMNHAAACNFMDACRNDFTDYRLIDWPADVPHPQPPMFAAGYRRDKHPAWIPDTSSPAH